MNMSGQVICKVWGHAMSSIYITQYFGIQT